MRVPVLHENFRLNTGWIPVFDQIPSNTTVFGLDFSYTVIIVNIDIKVVNKSISIFSSLISY